MARGVIFEDVGGEAEDLIIVSRRWAAHPHSTTYGNLLKWLADSNSWAWRQGLLPISLQADLTPVSPPQDTKVPLLPPIRPGYSANPPEFRKHSKWASKGPSELHYHILNRDFQPPGSVVSPVPGSILSTPAPYHAYHGTFDLNSWFPVVVFGTDFTSASLVTLVLSSSALIWTGDLPSPLSSLLLSPPWWMYMVL